MTVRDTSPAATSSGSPVFDLARRILTGDVLPVPVRGCEDEAAVRLLAALDYVWPAAGRGPVGQAGGDAAILRNRCALLALAARLDRVFQLEMTHAPGARFLGAMVSPAGFGLSGHPAMGAGGRGVTLRQAFESCVGEAAEYLSFIARGDEETWPSAGDNPPGEPDRAWFAAGLGQEIDGHDWMRARSLADGRDISVPAELVIRRPAPARRAPRAAESSGVAAGALFDDAVLAGLLEVVERDAVGLWWHGGNAARGVGADLIEGSGLAEFVAAVRRESARRCWLIDITSDLEIPVFAAISADDDGTAVVAGFGAGIDPGAALRSAVLELGQMELAQELALAKLSQGGATALAEQDRVWIARARQLSVAVFPDLLPRHPAKRDIPPADMRDPLSSAVSRLDEHGFRPCAVDLTRPDVGVPVARVIVPGLQSAQPDRLSARLAATAAANDRGLDGIGNRPAPI